MNDMNVPDTKEGSVRRLRAFLKGLFDKDNEGLTHIVEGCDVGALHIRGYVSTPQLEKLIQEHWLMVFIHTDSTLCVTDLNEARI